MPHIEVSTVVKWQMQTLESRDWTSFLLLDSEWGQLWVGAQIRTSQVQKVLVEQSQKTFAGDKMSFEMHLAPGSKCWKPVHFILNNKKFQQFYH